jgi:Protein of unknown function (DUF1236)
MNSRVIAATLSFGLTVALASTAASQWASDIRLAQASSDVAGSNLQGIGLTVSHKQLIYENIANEKAQTIAGDLRLSVGSTVPDSLTLNAMPIAVKDQIGLLKDFKFAKLIGDNILIVDPVSRKIVDIITKQEAER